MNEAITEESLYDTPDQIDFGGSSEQTIFLLNHENETLRKELAHVKLELEIVKAISSKNTEMVAQIHKFCDDNKVVKDTNLIDRLRQLFQMYFKEVSRVNEAADRFLPPQGVINWAGAIVDRYKTIDNAFLPLSTASLPNTTTMGDLRGWVVRMRKTGKSIERP